MTLFLHLTNCNIEGQNNIFEKQTVKYVMSVLIIAKLSSYMQLVSVY